MQAACACGAASEWHAQSDLQDADQAGGAEGKGSSGAGTRLADRESSAMVAKVASGTETTGTETVDDLLERWRSHAESIGRSPTTLREYQHAADKIMRPAIDSVQLSKLTSGDLDRLYAELTAKNRKATTVRRVHALIGCLRGGGCRAAAAGPATPRKRPGTASSPTIGATFRDRRTDTSDMPRSSTCIRRGHRKSNGDSLNVRRSLSNCKCTCACLP